MHPRRQHATDRPAPSGESLPPRHQNSGVARFSWPCCIRQRRSSGSHLQCQCLVKGRLGATREASVWGTMRERAGGWCVTVMGSGKAPAQPKNDNVRNVLELTSRAPFPNGDVWFEPSAADALPNCSPFGFPPASHGASPPPLERPGSAPLRPCMGARRWNAPRFCRVLSPAALLSGELSVAFGCASVGFVDDLGSPFASASAGFAVGFASSSAASLPSDAAMSSSSSAALSCRSSATATAAAAASPPAARAASSLARRSSLRFAISVSMAAEVCHTDTLRSPCQSGTPSGYARS
mmetsp:Transcript_14890/g.34341  ORF Transcript_14890/g.34341 Transcript_14890/m.34341 type:complete len:295 (+) Transcript_14890:90-974(+)